jgi:hypothetical protein
MLVLRDPQMAMVGKQAFEEQMAAHLRAFSPPLFKAVGEVQLRSTVRLGMHRAHTYGLTFRGPVRLYCELMLLFGSHFDTDPQYPWFAEILGRDASSQMQRADALYLKTLDYRKSVAGPEDAFTFAALRRIRELARRTLPLTPDTFMSAMVAELTHAYPQKAAYLGAEGIAGLIRAGVPVAREYGLTTLRGVALMIVLMLAFGHGCAKDPLYPWIERTLKDPAIVDIEARTRRLESKAMTWLDHVLAHLDGAQPA